MVGKPSKTKSGSSHTSSKTNASPLKNPLKSFLQRSIDHYDTRPGRWFEGSMFLLNFIAIIMFIIDTYPLQGTARSLLHWSEVGIVCLFILEYAARMWVAEKKVRHFFGIYSLVDLASIVPILAAFTDLGFLRIIRILRLVRMVRILRFQRMFKSKDTIFGRLTETDLILIRIGLTVFTIIFVASGLMWAVENKVNPEKFSSIWDAMYFTIVTIATVGYGDITPISDIGRIVTVLMILAGVTLIPWQLGKLLNVVISSNVKTRIKCPKCGHEEHDKDAVHCKFCGAVIKVKGG